MTCPVCHSPSSIELITFKQRPLLLHPVARDDQGKQWLADITYKFCSKCGHAFQSSYDRSFLDHVYRSAYWQPDCNTVQHSIRSEFCRSLDSASVFSSTQNQPFRLLEIGASSGQLLSDLRRIHPDAHLVGIEPNTKNSDAAQRAGLEVVSAFFGRDSAKNVGVGFDIVICRHVIEHIPDFDDFFEGLDSVSTPNTIVVFETPSLDATLDLGSIDPFHVEHLHVFSRRSLLTLAERFGWFARAHWTSSFANYVAVLAKSADKTISSVSIPPPDPNLAKGVHARIERWQTSLRQASDSASAVILWGGGSFGIDAMTLLDFRPNQIVDGNPNKAGLHFLGIDIPIGYAPDSLGRLVANDQDQSALVVIASTFSAEIRLSLADIGWRGAILAFNEIP